MEKANKTSYDLSDTPSDHYPQILRFECELVALPWLRNYHTITRKK
jgi:hypothetical protein